MLMKLNWVSFFTSLGLTLQWMKLTFIYLYVNLPINNEAECPGNHEQHVERQENDPGRDSVQFRCWNVERFPQAALHDVPLVVEEGRQGVQEAGQQEGGEAGHTKEEVAGGTNVLQLSDINISQTVSQFHYSRSQSLYSRW